MTSPSLSLPIAASPNPASTSASASATPAPSTHAARRTTSLHRRFLAAVGLVGAVGILLLAWGANAAFTAVADREGGLRDARVGIAIGVVVLLLTLAALVAVLHFFLARRISRPATELAEAAEAVDRKSTRLNSSHPSISY